VTPRLVRFALAIAVASLAGLVAACGSTVVTPSPATSIAAATPSASAAASIPPVTAPPPTPIGSTVDAPPCGPPDVAVDVNGLGATGSILLLIQVTNGGAAPCALEGPPTSIGLRAGGGSLPLAYQAHADPFPGDTPGKVAPPVVLDPGGHATAKAIWRNWCLGPADVSTVWVGLAADAVDASPNPAITPPRCDNEKAESTVAGYPFEVAATGG
jgi:hypothetical protein